MQEFDVPSQTDCRRMQLVGFDPENLSISNLLMYVNIVPSLKYSIMYTWNKKEEQVVRSGLHLKVTSIKCFSFAIPRP